MSYLNPPLHILLVEPICQLSTSIVDRCFTQHIIIVDLLLDEKTQQNGWSNCATPIYPSISKVDRKETSTITNK